MGDVEKGDAHLAVNALQCLLHALAHLQIQGSQGLIEEQDGRFIHQRTGQPHPLLLPTAELMRIARLIATKFDDLQHIGDA